MDKQSFVALAANFMENAKDNQIEMDHSEDLPGTRIYDAPIFGFANPQDPEFLLLKSTKVIGEHFRLPNEWLPSAKTVISFFLPFSQTVKNSNGQGKIWPSQEWLVGRVEGQQLLNELGIYLQNELNNSGFTSIIPSLDKNFFSKTAPESELNEKGELQEQQLSFTSNWSERHVAYICGLGTFGLSKGLITSKGMAGRFGSLVTELKLEPDQRTYETFDAYCTKCGSCIKRCPVKAISFEKGKNHRSCSDFLKKTREKFKPRYGCGKCQVSVPCESGIPEKAIL
ncbi:4Fe-4S binding protein [Acetobacterium sp.]|uniref:4Fe-4S binding protein n=1 Tax=Acetobacterium sp. TaxID=1872094 RepID=UPI002F3F3CC8